MFDIPILILHENMIGFNKFFEAVIFGSADLQLFLPATIIPTQDLESCDLLDTTEYLTAIDEQVRSILQQYFCGVSGCI